MFKFFEGSRAEIDIGNVKSYFFVAPQNINLLKNELIDVVNTRNQPLLNDRAYWITWKDNATGDLPSMSAAILMGFNHGIKIERAEGQGQADTKKLEEVASYLGCVVIGDYAVDSNMNIKATVDGRINALKPSEVIAGERGKKFSWLTRVVATGKYIDEEHKYQKFVRKNGLKIQDFKKIQRTWFGVIDGNRKNKMKTFLTQKGLNVDTLRGKDVEVLWIRTSGENSGTHYENDTSFNALKTYIKQNLGKFFILAGDDKKSKAAEIAKNNINVFNLTRFWNDPQCQDWGGETRTGQLAIYEYLKNYCGCKSFIHIGSMSGGLEALALIGHFVKFKAKKGERGVDRMEQYAISKKCNISYELNPFIVRDLVLNGYEKRAAKYYNLFSNFEYPATHNLAYRQCVKIMVGVIKNEFKKLIVEKSKKKFIRPQKVLVEIFKDARKPTKAYFSNRIGKIGIEMAKKFAKIEKNITKEQTLNEYMINIDGINYYHKD